MELHKKLFQLIGATKIVALLTIAFTTPSFAQPLNKRLSLEMETSYNRSNDYSPASFSLGSEVKCWITNKFYTGIRLDVGVGSFGDNHYSLSSNSGFSLYYYGDASLATISSLSLKGYYEFHLLKTRMFVGYGLGRYMGTGIIGYKTLPINSISTFVGSRKLDPAWMICRTIGIRGDGINFSLTSSSVSLADKNGDIPNLITTTLGIEIGNGKNLSSFKTTALHQLPILMVDLGTEILIPFGSKSGGATAFRFYAEPKLRLNHKSSIGISIKTVGNGIGYDANGWPFDTIFIKNGVPTIPGSYNNGNKISLISSMGIYYDYYFRKKEGWLYVGSGLGYYSSKGKKSWTQTDDFGMPIITPPIPKEKTLGYLIRFGYKTGAFRTGFDINFVGKHIPFQVGFHVGIEPGVFFRKSK